MGIDGVDSYVLRDRIHLSEDGIMVVVAGINEMTKELSSLEIVCKGIVVSDKVLKEARSNVINGLTQIDLRKVATEEELSQIIRKSVKNYIFKATKKNPMILPVILEV